MERLIKALSVAAQVTGSELSAEAVAFMARTLVEHGEEAALQAVERAARECRGRLTLAAIIDKVPGRIGAEEAWEIALQAELWDENRTVVVPRAIFYAFPWALWEEGDRVAARMAFKERYPALADEHRGQMHVSEGWDKARREGAIVDAVRNSMLTVDQGLVHLPPWSDPAVLENLRPKAPKTITEAPEPKLIPA